MEDAGTRMGMRGRNGIMALVAECLDQPHGAERPVTMLVGPRGSGASEAHNAVMERFGADHPFAYLNFAADQALLPRYALALIARQLERKLPQYRASRFPRLTLGLLASDRELRMTTRSDGRRAIQSQLDQFRQQAEERYGDYLGTFLEVAGSAMGAPNGASAVVATLLRDAARGGGRRLLPGRRFAGAPQWFADHPLVPSRDPWDALLELNMWRHNGTEQEKRILDRVLFAAFLDDLRHDTGRRFAPGSYLLLLDNCHADHGRLFLELLVGARRDAALAGTLCDPLTVVGSSNRWLDNWGSSSGDQWPWRLRSPDRASLADWRERRPGHDSGDSWWYPLRLRDLTLDEVRTGIELASPRHSGLAPFVYRLTRGLPAAVRQVMDALDLPNAPGRGGELDLWLRSLPGRRMRGTPGLSLADAALDHLLEDFSAAQREALVRCAAARDLAVGSRILGAVAPGGAGEPLFNEVRSRWLLEADRARPRLHPWLRRLLLWRLAADPDEWDTVHELLAEYSEAEDRPADALYHRLAAHHVDEVVDRLTGHFREMAAVRWIRLVNEVTSAPNRLPPDRPPLELLGDLAPEEPAHSITDTSVIRGLVCARWLWSDPLGDPGLRLNSVIAARYDRLSELRGSDIVALYDEAERYRHWRHRPTGAEGA